MNKINIRKITFLKNNIKYKYINDKLTEKFVPSKMLIFTIFLTTSSFTYILYN